MCTTFRRSNCLLQAGPSLQNQLFAPFRDTTVAEEASALMPAKVSREIHVFALAVHALKLSKVGHAQLLPTQRYAKRLN
jgi:hypothetical protein